MATWDSDWPWVQPWVPVKSHVCARYDCNELRELGRRYCEKHAEEYERQANEIPEDKKLVRPGSFGERAGVPGNPPRGRGTGGTV